MSRPDKDSYIMRLLPGIAARSHDPRTKVGCIVADKQNRIRVTGTNGLVSGVRDDFDHRLKAPLKYDWMIHAEINSICSAASSGTSLTGCTMFIDLIPCSPCFNAAVQAGIDRFVIDKDRTDFYMADNPDRSEWYTSTLDHIDLIVYERKILTGHQIDIKWWRWQ
jgi:deoxycytidylate deaminase